MTSGRARTHVWKLTIDRACAPWIEPLMGWTAGDDPTCQVEIDFPDLDAAVSHARRLGVAYEVHMPASKKDAVWRKSMGGRGGGRRSP